MIDFSYYFRLMNDKLDYIAIDFETANQYKNSACSIGLVHFINGKETDSCYSLIHPAKMYFIPEWTRDIHHISYNHVRDTKNQIVLIAGIKGLLQQYKGTPLFDNIEKLFYLFEPKIAKSSGLISSARIAVPPQMEFNINLNNWEKILKAMEQNKKIKSRYTAPYKNSELQITLWPYQILLDNGTVYLFAHREYKDDDLLYDLNKLEGITVTNEEFELPKDFDFTKRCKGGRLGAFSSNKIVKYEIEVTGYASYWIKDHKLTDDQTFEDIDDEDVIVRFSSCQFEKVMKLVLSLGSSAKPLAPKSFVDKWKKEVTTMFESFSE